MLLPILVYKVNKVYKVYKVYKVMANSQILDRYS